MSELPSGYNLPPGVFESDLPGNRPEDIAWEKLQEDIETEIELGRWTLASLREAIGDERERTEDSVSRLVDDLQEDYAYAEDAREALGI